MMRWSGLIVTASCCMSLPLLTPKKLQNTAPATRHSDAAGGADGGSGGDDSGDGIMLSMVSPRFPPCPLHPRRASMRIEERRPSGVEDYPHGGNHALSHHALRRRVPADRNPWRLPVDDGAAAEIALRPAGRPARHHGGRRRFRR